MKSAPVCCILHHHLRSGGVTTVIEGQVQALKVAGYQPGSIRLLVGEAPDKSGHMAGVAVRVHSDLAYWKMAGGVGEIRERAGRILEFLNREIPAGAILHIHNLSLGKNPALNLAVCDYARAGGMVLSHCHDFAEDGRLENLRGLQRAARAARLTLADLLYPPFQQFHFAVLNQRDLRLLAGMGIDEARLHWLPNPVAPSPAGQTTAAGDVKPGHGRAGKGPLYLYPVKALQRKNIGEFVLLCVLEGGRGRWVISRRPLDRKNLAALSRWEIFATSRGLPVRFGTGVPPGDFPGLMASADFLVSTSCQEGFGYTYVDSCRWGKPFLGRRAGALLEDLGALGMRFPGAYSRLLVPVELVPDLTGLGKRYRKILEQRAAFSCGTWPAARLHRLWKQVLAPPAIDFAHLDPGRQRRVIDRCLSEPRHILAIRELNHLAARAALPAGMARQNHRLAERKLGLKAYVARLGKMYGGMQLRAQMRMQARKRNMKNGRAMGRLKHDVLLQACCLPDRFFQGGM